jgi:triosephosphate isomerase
MNPATREEASGLLGAVYNFVSRNNYEGVVICPPFPWLTIGPRQYFERMALGAQDVFWAKAGAYTGEVSAAQLRSAGVSYVIVGHSERRALGENNEIVSKKLRAVLEEGLVAVLCVGEPKSVREKGIEAAQNFVREQLRQAFAGIRINALTKNNRPGALRAMVAYEPIWAISAVSGGEADAPDDAAKMMAFIRDTVESGWREWRQNDIGGFDLKVLYGGSVNGKNAMDFLRLPGGDGVLVGAASLNQEEFFRIIEAACYDAQ